MKKYLWAFIIFVMFAAVTPAQAVSLKVASLQDFTTEKPAQTLKVITLERTEFKNGLVFEEGTIIKGEVYDVRPPMRGKMNATFKFKPLYYSYNGQKKEINREDIIGKYSPYKEMDKAEIAVSAASTTGSMVLKIPGFGQAVSFVKGTVKNPEGNRLESGVKQIYKDSFLSYIEEGKEVVLKKDQLFILKFKIKGEPEEDEAKSEESDSGAQIPEQKQEPETPVNQTKSVPTAPASQSSATSEPQDSTIHPVDPYEVLKEVQSAK